MSSLFSRIIARQVPAKIVYEDDLVVVIEDIHPAAPVHLLIIPRKEITNLQAMEEEDLPLLAHVGKVAQQLAESYEITSGYRLLTNSGKDAGQTIWHLHFHLIGGRRLGALA